MKYKLIIKNKLIDAAHFTNIVINGILLKELDWVKAFISEYQSFLKEEERDVIIIYCTARILFAEQNFEKAIDLLNKIKNPPHGFDFRIRSLSLRCVFELFLQQSSYFDFLISQINAFEKYIRRDAVWNAERKAAYLNFCRIIEKLVDLRAQKNEKLALKINDELSTQPVIAKRWLLKVLNRIT